MNGTALFVDFGGAQCSRTGESACGDAMAFRRIPEENRYLAVLSDGLGHGVKANILALMTSTMAMKFLAGDDELDGEFAGSMPRIVHDAEIIMDALPVSPQLHISYATFTLVDARPGGETRVIEMGNPPFLFFRGTTPVELPHRVVASPKYRDRTMAIAEFPVRAGDRIVFCSDGVTQSGLGSERTPRGWGTEGCREYLEKLLAREPEISANELSGSVMREAVAHEPNLKPADDISCCCVYFRSPRELMLFTGPPFHAEHDADCARKLAEFPGTKVICGGTTAAIVAREWHRALIPDPASGAGDLPPTSRLEGVALVTEGIYTLARTVRYLERGESANHADPAGTLARLLLDNDVLCLLVGTRINEAHQDPNLPQDLELRRNLSSRLADVLRNKYLRDVRIEYV